MWIRYLHLVLESSLSRCGRPELREDRRVVVNRDVPLLKRTVQAIVDDEIESAEEFPDARRAFGRRVGDLDATVTTLAARLDRLGMSG